MARVSDHRVRALATVAERMIRALPNHATARSLQGVVNRLSAGATALDNVAANRSPLDTEAAHALKVANMARKFDREVTASMNRLGEIYRAGLQDTQRRIDEKIDLKPDAFAKEIREAFRTMNAAAKAKLIHELVDANRGPELAAIVKAPSILTGITDEQRASYEKMMLSKHAGAELEERAALEGICQEGMTAASIAGDLAQSLTDPSKIAAIEHAATIANEAGAAFDQSLQ